MVTSQALQQRLCLLSPWGPWGAEPSGGWVRQELGVVLALPATQVPLWVSYTGHVEHYRNDRFLFVLKLQ